MCLLRVATGSRLNDAVVALLQPSPASDPAVALAAELLDVVDDAVTGVQVRNTPAPVDCGFTSALTVPGGCIVPCARPCRRAGCSQLWRCSPSWRGPVGPAPPRSRPRWHPPSARCRRWSSGQRRWSPASSAAAPARGSTRPPRRRTMRPHHEALHPRPGGRPAPPCGRRSAAWCRRPPGTAALRGQPWRRGSRASERGNRCGHGYTLTW